MSHFCAQQLTLLRNPHIEQTNNTQLIEWEGAIIIIKANKEWSNEYTNAYNDDPKNDEHELSPYEMFLYKYGRERCVRIRRNMRAHSLYFVIFACLFVFFTRLDSTRLSSTISKYIHTAPIDSTRCKRANCWMETWHWASEWVNFGAVVCHIVFCCRWLAEW